MLLSITLLWSRRLLKIKTRPDFNIRQKFKQNQGGYTPFSFQKCFHISSSKGSFFSSTTTIGWRTDESNFGFKLVLVFNCSPESSLFTKLCEYVCIRLIEISFSRNTIFSERASTRHVEALSLKMVFLFLWFRMFDTVVVSREKKLSYGFCFA